MCNLPLPKTNSFSSKAKFDWFLNNVYIDRLLTKIKISQFRIETENSSIFVTNQNFWTNGHRFIFQPGPIFLNICPKFKSIDFLSKIKIGGFFTRSIFDYQNLSMKKLFLKCFLSNLNFWPFLIKIDFCAFFLIIVWSVTFNEIDFCPQFDYFWPN